MRMVLERFTRGGNWPNAALAADLAEPPARGPLDKGPFPLMAMAALIPYSIRDAGSFHSRKRTFMATLRVFVQQRFASRGIYANSVLFP